jgi:CPA1 family monovalent cation:H+ antiporter
MHHSVLLLAGIVALGIFCQWIAWRFKIPAILPLLATGFLAGPVFGLLHPQELLGDLTFPVISLAVAVILFEGALTLRWREVRQVASVVRNLITVGALITWLGGALAARLITGLSWELAILFGALISVTGPTVINPLLRNVRPTAKIASILRWEGILIDPLGASLAVLVFEFIVAEGTSPQSGLQPLAAFLHILVIGSLCGLIGGALVALLLRRYLVPDYLRDVAVLAIVIAAFAVSDYLRAESGLLAVTVMGVFLANLRVPQLQHVWHFKEKLSVLLISALFIVLAANIQLQDLARLNARSLLLVAVVIFILRPIGVQLSALGSPLNNKERLFLSWIAPRGIVAAAVSSLFAFRLEELGFTGATDIASLVFLVIVSTVILQGGTAKLVARSLGVAEAEPQGFLLLGAHHFARHLALALQEEGFAVRLADTNIQNAALARARGLDVYEGDLLYEEVEEGLDLTGLGRLLALTSNDEVNTLACVHLSHIFDSSEVYQLPPDSQPPVLPAADNRFGRLLFNRQATFDAIDVWMDNGAFIEKKQITSPLDFEQYRQQGNGRHLPLLAFRDKQVTVFTAGTTFTPPAGWTLVSLVAPAGFTPRPDGAAQAAATTTQP